MILKNAEVFDHRFELRKLDIEVSDDRITKVSDTPLFGEDELDLSGCLILPGFVDIHIHGGGGGDFSSGDADALSEMSAHLANHGVTSFCPATMTLPKTTLSALLSTASDYRGREKGAYIHGVYLEGPYINPVKKGAQPECYIRLPDYAEFRSLSALCPVSVVALAPEMEGAMDFAGKASSDCTVSMAHTNATFEEGTKALQSGFSHCTHLYNAMPQLQSRNPGVISAVYDSETATAELICDGFHVHPSMIRLAFRQMGEDRVCVVSDSMCAAGCPDGEYALSGQTVLVKDGKALLPDGTIAASTTDLYHEFRNLLSFGIPMRAAVKACSINPAKVIGADQVTGSIEPGKKADLLVLGSDLSILHVFIQGKRFL